MHGAFCWTRFFIGGGFSLSWCVPMRIYRVTGDNGPPDSKSHHVGLYQDSQIELQALTLPDKARPHGRSKLRGKQRRNSSKTQWAAPTEDRRFGFSGPCWYTRPTAHLRGLCCANLEGNGWSPTRLH